MNKNFIAFLLLGTSFIIHAQDFSWLEGTWQGPGFGGTMEEIWSAPNKDGQSIGMFRFSDAAGQVQFLEFWVLDQSGMKLKHFNPDFSGWEEKDDYVSFEMIAITPNKVVLKGLTYELSKKGRLKIDLDMKKENQVATEHFELIKVKK